MNLRPRIVVCVPVPVFCAHTASAVVPVKPMPLALTTVAMTGGAIDPTSAPLVLITAAFRSVTTSCPALEWPDESIRRSPPEVRNTPEITSVGSSGLSGSATAFPPTWATVPSLATVVIR